MMYYIQSYEHQYGDFIAWWGKRRSGYVQCLEDAGLYTEEEAKEICHSANLGRDIRERMLPQEEVEAAALRVVRFNGVGKELKSTF
jgi:hypothetical protein